MEGGQPASNLAKPSLPTPSSRRGGPRPLTLTVGAVAATVLVAYVFSVHDIADRPEHSAKCSASMADSDGFFCEPDDQWARRSKVHAYQAKLQRAGDVPAVGTEGFSWPLFWQTHWEPDFSCAFERRIGQAGDGGKWVCDPDRLAEIADTKSCLIYSVGSYNEFGFEEAMHKEFPQCEIHTFDHTVAEPNPPPFVQFHKIGLSADDYPAGNVFTLASIQKKLGHGPGSGKRVALLKMDIEGGEWDVLDGALREVDGVSGLDGVQQVLFEAHPPQVPHGDLNGEAQDEKVHRIFETLHSQGWAIFHKEANILAWGQCIEYALLKTNWISSPTHKRPE